MVACSLKYIRLIKYDVHENLNMYGKNNHIAISLEYTVYTYHSERDIWYIVHAPILFMCMRTCRINIHVRALYLLWIHAIANKKNKFAHFNQYYIFSVVNAD